MARDNKWQSLCDAGVVLVVVMGVVAFSYKSGYVKFGITILPHAHQLLGLFVTVTAVGRWFLQHLSTLRDKWFITGCAINCG